MGLNFQDKVVVITGAGGGLGRAYALAFAKLGAKIVVNDLGGSTKGEGADTRAADKVVNEIKQLGGIAVADYNSVVDGAKVIKTALDNFQTIDIVINNAGILRDVSFHKMSESDWDLLNAVHLKGVFAITRAAWPILRNKKYGRIINVSSAAGLYGNFGQAHYSTVKMGIIGLTKTLSHEGKKRNILVNCIAPLAASRMTATVLPPDLLESLKPEYVVPLVLYLCHETSKETGSIFEVGGGFISKLRWEASNGVTFNIDDPSKFTAESVANKINEINDFSKNTSYPTSANDSFAKIMENLQSKL